MIDRTMSVILSSGGVGSRMGSPLPKQYLRLNGKIIARYSFELFLSLPEVAEIIVVCAAEYHHFFEVKRASGKEVKFALPGARRQDSVFNGLQKSDRRIPYLCIHDAARPFLEKSIVGRTLQAAIEFGAATAAMPIKFTVKEGNDQTLVYRTPERSKIWEIQTPQIIRRDLMEAGFSYVMDNNINVTDDVSVVELLSQPVKLVQGDERNIKITTPFDLKIAEALQDNNTYKLAQL